MLSPPSSPKWRRSAESPNGPCSEEGKEWWHNATTTATSDERVKRVSLDATETSMTDDDDDDDWTGGAFLDAIQQADDHGFLLDATVPLVVCDDDADSKNEIFLHPSSPPHLNSMLLHSDDKEDGMWDSFLDTSDKDYQNTPMVNQASLDDLWKLRRKHLAASMERSQQSRAWVEAHIQRRATLRRVLQQIYTSTRQVRTLLQQQAAKTVLDQQRDNSGKDLKSKRKKRAV
jgi:hypothetical protein